MVCELCSCRICRGTARPHLRSGLPGEENVLGLDVAVHDAPRVHVCNGLDDLGHEQGGPALLEMVLGQLRCTATNEISQLKWLDRHEERIL